MPRTKQQQAAIDTVLSSDVSLVKIQAVAGAGKTFTLIELAKELNPKTGIYLAYNKAIADEASQKFKGTNIQCSTIHSLAYAAVVRQYGLKVGYFGVRNVQPSDLPYSHKLKVVNTLEDFFLTAYTDPVKYLDAVGASAALREVFMDHLNKMTMGEIQCSHGFYLKLYHVYLATGEIPTPEVDLLLCDEAGDITELTLDIFRLIKSPKKVAVGDPYQNIYSFNKTINAFEALKDEGVEVNLTESFRVSRQIAGRVQKFVQNNLCPEFNFTGKEYDDEEPITSRAYIARTNSGLLQEMFRLMEDYTPFHTTRKIGIILELPLIISNIGNGKAITDYKYKHLEKLRKEWESNEAVLSVKHHSIHRFIANTVDDPEVHLALSVMYNHGPTSLNELTKYATACAKKPCTLTLTTAHSSKGLEFSEVEIAPDLNQKVEDTLSKLEEAKGYSSADPKLLAEMLNSLNEELRLYYVAVTRAMVSLVNAEHLGRGVLH